MTLLIWKIIFSILMGVGLGSIMYFFIWGILWLIRKIFGLWFIDHKRYHESNIQHLNYEMSLMEEINKLKAEVSQLQNQTQWLEAKHKENK